MEKRYRVTLTIEERKDLQKLVSVGKAAARKLMRARAILLANQSVDGPANSQAVCGEGFGSGPETGNGTGPISTVSSVACRAFAKAEALAAIPFCSSNHRFHTDGCG